MSGSREGGRKAAATNKKLYGNRYYQQIGRIGGENGHTGGFTTGSELARIAGAKGGMKSKRGKGSMVKTKIEPYRDMIQVLYDEGESIPQIAKRYRVSDQVLRKWARDNVIGYGDRWSKKDGRS